MNYCVTDKASGKNVDFDFNPTDESKKAIFRSKEDAFYFMDCAIRSKSGEEGIESGRGKFEVKEAN